MQTVLETNAVHGEHLWRVNTLLTAATPTIRLIFFLVVNMFVCSQSENQANDVGDRKQGGTCIH